MYARAMKQLINITVARYYGKPSYYSVMPNEIFVALETAFVHGEPSTKVDRNAWRTMMQQHNEKLLHYEKVNQSRCH